MTSPRIRRLRLDNERLQERFSDWGPIQIVDAVGDPPERYRIAYRVKGLVVGAGGEIHERDEHLVEINLTLEYPRRAPQCKILGPVFHPNFDTHTICIGDFWAASEGLDDLIIRIGRMITYQEYNTKSPLNGLAARWASENAHLLPVDPAELAPPLQRESEDLALVRICIDETDSQATEVDPDAQPLDRWYYLDAQAESHGPLTAAEILDRTEATPCWVWREGLPDWVSSDDCQPFQHCAKQCRTDD
jgi:ubiquitin-protein ligase